MFCKYCGSSIEDGSRFCPNCGGNQFDDVNNQNADPNADRNDAQSYQEAYQTNEDGTKYRDPQVVAIAMDKINTNYTIWFVIAIIQIVMGVLTLCAGVGVLGIGFGIWNLVQANTMKKNIAVFAEDPGLIYYYFEPRLTILIVMLVLNVIFGGVIGCIAMIHELTVRNFVIEHYADLS